MKQIFLFLSVLLAVVLTSCGNRQGGLLTTNKIQKEQPGVAHFLYCYPDSNRGLRRERPLS